ncbi:hypothetical protein M9458_041694, partial [Cirrhinus mrigala]
MAASPESLHRMAASPESLRKVATNPESPRKMAASPESLITENVSFFCELSACLMTKEVLCCGSHLHRSGALQLHLLHPGGLQLRLTRRGALWPMPWLPAFPALL